MRILIVGADSKYAIERPYLKYLSQHPSVSAIELFAAQQFFLGWYQKSIFNKILYRAGLSRILHSINDDLLRKVESFKPDVLFVFKGMEIFPAILKTIKDKGIKLANYNPDNPFIFSGRGSGNKNVTNSIPLFDLFMSYDRGICREMESRFNITSRLLPFGFDIPDALFEACKREPEIVKLCFIGNTDTFRLEFLNNLATAGIELDLYGMNWKESSLHKNIQFKGAVFEEELWKKLRAYRVQLNLMRIHNPDSHNMRSFEIAGIGGIQLAPATEDHRIYFTDGKDIFLYTDQACCIAQIKKLLAMPVEAANQVREAVRARSIGEGYTYKDRANTVAKYLQDLMKRN
jgi:spore maturation protein CgeB